MEHPMQKLNDLSRCLTPLEPDSTLIAVIEMSLSSWLVAGIVPGVERQPLKKLAVDESVLLKLLHRWREEAEKAGYMIKRITVAFEAGRDGFWLARWLRARDIRTGGQATWQAVAEAKKLMPVMFPPGRRRLEAKPLATGSLQSATIGTVRVAFFSAWVAGVPSATRTSTRNRTNSAASFGRASCLPSAKRYSKAMFCPSIQPCSFNP
jgi:hypothetical protein